MGPLRIRHLARTNRNALGGKGFGGNIFVAHGGKIFAISVFSLTSSFPISFFSEPWKIRRGCSAFWPARFSTSSRPIVIFRLISFRLVLHDRFFFSSLSSLFFCSVFQGTPSHSSCTTWQSLQNISTSVRWQAME